MKPSASLLLGGVLVGSLLMLVGCSRNSTIHSDSSPEPAASELGAAATVMEVIDGDTVVVKVAGQTEPVRLIGIDTPEATGGYLPAECYGDEATAFTKALLPVDTEVHLTRDTEARDRYERLLAYVHRSADSLFVNLEIAAQGYGEALVIEPNTTHASAFYTAAAAARDQGLGLWGHCGSADIVLE